MTTMLKTLLLVTLVACASSKSNPDAGTQNPDGSGLPVDGFGGPSFGDNCTTSADCQGNSYCVDGANGGICTYGCDLGCPEGWNCRISDIAGEPVSLCMPQKFDFCKPCTADVQCNGGVCVQLDGAGYCLPDCPFEGTCPTGYTCNADPSGAHPGNYCVPDTGSCTCNAEHEGQIRTCENTNGAGTCYGVETCMPDNGGWTGCTAATASTEVCDGMDNDCDQLIDDGVSGSACPITNGYGTCQGVQLCTGTSFICQGQDPAMEACNGFDDDCDAKLDETWPEVAAAMPCSPGVGACQRFGVMRCNAAGNGSECSVTEGAPASELCNGLDDNCNGSTDETFTTLGDPCSAGVGACARQGNLVCAANGLGTQCSVTEGAATTETCNGVDDDCNGVVDNGFKNGSGVYNQNTHCGSCATDCTAIYNLPNASGVCNAGASSASCAMQCVPGAFNLDGSTANGCELVLDPTAIYVSINDVNAADNATCGLGPVGTGAGNYPCLTIAQGLARATSTGRANVRVANGIYNEAVTLVAGKNLLGGHAPDNWQRNVSGTGTLITGVATIASTNHDYTVRALNITTTTMFEGFVVIGGVNAKQSGNSYAIYVSGSSNALTIANNVVYGGKGGPGQNGGAGSTGLTGVDGVGRPSNPAGYDAKVATGTAPCEAAANDRAYANGGQHTCGADDVSGGNGGGNRCNPRPVYDSENSGIDGVTGQAGTPGGASGNGADAGDDGALSRYMGNTVCFVPSNPDYGRDGAMGSDAGHGTAGTACSATTGSVVSGHWVGASAGGGGSGGNGGGGGGGGAGGGARCDGPFAGTTACQDGRDRLGGHGGGAGSGGCGGTGGSGATAGGGAFAIFIAGGASAPVVTGNSLLRGEGGLGGTGGAGGSGGAGGFGAAGGTSTEFCAGAAGRGGNGGDGGHGGGGGGGCGGGSFGIFTSGIGSPNYCMATANNTISSGSGGTGGAGGYSLINTGQAGSTGALATCQFN